MFILDTNVISELMKMSPADVVVHWLEGESAEELYTTTINQAEILYGIMLLPTGKRRLAMESAAQAMFNQDFLGKILSFNTHAAIACAKIASDRSRAGHPISTFDAQIAAIAQSTNAAIVTRNVTDFYGCGVNLINPWQP